MVNNQDVLLDKGVRTVFVLGANESKEYAVTLFKTAIGERNSNR